VTLYGQTRILAPDVRSSAHPPFQGGLPARAAPGDGPEGGRRSPPR
jgi:hypothetical protein